LRVGLGVSEGVFCDGELTVDLLGLVVQLPDRLVDLVLDRGRRRHGARALSGHECPERHERRANRREGGTACPDGSGADDDDLLGGYP